MAGRRYAIFWPDGAGKSTFNEDPDGRQDPTMGTINAA